MIWLTLSLLTLVVVAVPAWLFRDNLRFYRPPPVAADTGPPPRVSVLIPARNEEAAIGPAVAAALASIGVELEVIVLDDDSTDATAAIVQQIAQSDPRVRLVHGGGLPQGWCGKQHACWVLAGHATSDLLLFLDADVRLAPAGLARLVAFLRHSGADLVSGIPLQETGTLAERLVIPLIHFVLLGFLPLRRMRSSRHPAYGAGCGQLFLARRAAYKTAGGHAAIRSTLHDGIRLPRLFREAGLATDLCDATSVAQCRMYRGFGQLWHGLAKNATEGLAAPPLIGLTTVVLLGQAIPLALFAVALTMAPEAIFPAATAVLCSAYPRWAGVRRFGQSWIGALLHPFGVLILLAIQWTAFVGHVLGRPRGWKGRPYPR